MRRESEVKKVKAPISSKSSNDDVIRTDEARRLASPVAQLMLFPSCGVRPIASALPHLSDLTPTKIAAHRTITTAARS
jgi:hypothetical protein